MTAVILSIGMMEVNGMGETREKITIGAVEEIVLLPCYEVPDISRT